MSFDQNTALILLVVFVIVGLAILIADAVIFIRWVAYVWATQRVEEANYAAARLAGAPYTRPDAGVQSAKPYGDGNARDLARMELAAAVDTPELPGDEADDAETRAAELPAAPEPPAPIFPEMPRYPFARTWSLVDPWLAFQFVFIVGQVVITLALLPLLLAPGHGGVSGMFSPPGIIIQSIGIVFLNALFVAVTAFYVRRYGISLKEIGLGRPEPRLIALGCGLGLLLFGAATGAEWALGGILPHVVPKAILDGMVKLTKALTAGGMFEGIQSLPLKIFFALAGAVAAPIGEEVFFRGFLYNSLKRRINVPSAIILSGLMFAVVHFGPLAILVIFPMGMLLAYVYEKTKSLWVTICMHAVHNGLSFYLMMAHPHFGEAPKEPVKPVAPPTKPAIVSMASPRSLRQGLPPIRGVTIHG